MKEESAKSADGAFAEAVDSKTSSLYCTEEKVVSTAINECTYVKMFDMLSRKKAVVIANDKSLISASFIQILRINLPPVCLCSADSEPYGGCWFWNVYRQALYGRNLVINLANSSTCFVEDTLNTLESLREKVTMKEESNTGLHACLTAKLEVLYAVALSIVVRVAQLPILPDNAGPQVLCICATKDECDEVAYILEIFANSLHLVVHNLFDQFPSIPANRLPDIVVATLPLWDGMVDVNNTSPDNGNELILTELYNCEAAPTYSRVRWRPYQLKYVSHLVIVDADLQIACGHWNLLKNLLYCYHRVTRSDVCVNTISVTDSENVCQTSTEQSLLRREAHNKQHSLLPSSPSSSSFSSCDAYANYETNMSQLYVVYSFDSLLSRSLQFVEPFAELLAFTKMFSSARGNALIEIQPKIRRGHYKRLRNDDLFDKHSNATSAGLLVEHALTHIRLYHDTTLYEELHNVIMEEVNTFWNSFDVNNCDCSVNLAQSVNNTTDASSSVHSNEGRVEHQQNVYHTNDVSDIVSSWKKDRNVEDSERENDNNSCAKCELDSKMPFASTASMLKHDHERKRKADECISCELAYVCANARHILQQENYCTELCIWIKPINEAEREYESRLRLLFRHMEDYLSGKMFDGSVISCTNLQELSKCYSVSMLKKEETKCLLIEDTIEEIEEIIANSVKQISVNFLCVEYLPQNTTLFTKDDSLTVNVESKADERSKIVKIQVHQETLIDHPQNKVTNATSGCCNDAWGSKMVSRHISDFHLKKSVPSFLFLDKHSPEHPFTTIVLRNIATTEELLIGVCASGELTTEEDKNINTRPLAVLLLEECCQYGEVISYYCHKQTKESERIANDDIITNNAYHPLDKMEVSTIHLFIEFNCHEAAREAVRQFLYRYSNSTSTNNSTSLLCKKEFNIHLFRNETYYSGVLNEMQRWRNSSDDVNNDGDSVDSVFGFISLLDEESLLLN